ncbi:MAG: hypothetical protein JHC40_02755 [Burkholderiales bacterium]|nr:hypothetical protein [Burkholderiales bacterium]
MALAFGFALVFFAEASFFPDCVLAAAVGAAVVAAGIAAAAGLVAIANVPGVVAAGAAA